MIKVPEETLIRFEEELNKITFQSMPLGGVVVNLLVIELLIGNRAWTIKERLHDGISVANLIFRSNRSFFRKGDTSKFKKWIDENRGKPILSFISHKPHFLKMNLELLKQIEEKEAICFLRHREIAGLLEDHLAINHFHENDIKGLSFKEWREEFDKVKKPIGRIIKNFVKTNRLPRFIGTRIYSFLIAQTQSLFALQKVLSSLMPNYVVVEYDRHTWCSPLVTAANNLGIYTISQMHGVVNNRFSYLPLLADELLCWGQRQREMLIQLQQAQESATSLIVTGAPQLSQKIEADRHQVRQKIGLSKDQKVVLLATNPVHQDYRKKLIQIFGDALRQHPKLKGVVRLHPSEKMEFYQEFQTQYPQILFDNNQVLNFSESMAVSDLCCVYNSAFGVDAIIKNVPVMVINVGDDQLGQGEDFLKQGQFPSATTHQELARHFSDFFSDPDFNNQVQQKMKAYAQDYCYAFEKDAALNALERIAKSIKFNPAVTEKSI